MKTFNARFGAWALLLSLLGSPFASILTAQTTFTNVTATVVPDLPAIRGDVAWADYDNDGRLDFLLMGYAANSYIPVSQLWRNTESGFTNVTATVAPSLTAGGSVAWADYDNDGRLDFFLTSSGIWRNTGSGFTNVTATVAPGLTAGDSVAWGDYDNDGRLDFLLTGGAFVSQVWRNTGSGFTNVTATVAPGLPGVVSGSVAWGDYDNDGRLDFLLTGGIPRRTDQDDDTSLTPISQLWRNTGNGFANVTDIVAPGLPGVHWSSVAWGDYDNDGRLDFFLSGWNRAAYRGLSQVWRNTGNGFVNVTATVAPGLPGVHSGSVDWGDYDNDGRLDFLLSGYDSFGRSLVSQVWRNTAGGFTNMTATVAPGLPKVTSSSLAWGDYDSDGRLDFLLVGATGTGCEVCDPPGAISQLWKNNTVQASPPPAVITGPPSTETQSSVALSARINPRGQAANVWFVWGNSTNYGQVTAAQPMGNGSSFTNFSDTITGLSTGVTYYYRAVGSNDQGLVFPGFEQRFSLAVPFVTTHAGGSMNPTSATFKGQANPNNLPAYGWFEWGLTPAYGQVTPVQFLGSGFNTGFAENLSGLEGSTTYYFRAVASNNLGVAYGGARSMVTPVMNVCPGSLSPTSRSHGSGGGAAYSVYVLLQCNWMAINTNSWITITSATNGNYFWGSSLTYNVAANYSWEPRSGYITIGGHSFRVTQGAEQPVLVVQPPAQNVLGGGTATFSVTVTGAPPFTYQWQFNGVPLTDGVGISGASTSNLVLTGVQNSQAGYYQVVAAISNGTAVGFSSPATLTVLCGFTISSNNASFSSLSATGLVALSATATNCPWNIVNTNAWVSILSGVINRGNGTVVYAVAENPTAIARSGSIMIADQTFTITQAGGAFTNAATSLAEALDTVDTLSWGTVGTPAWFGQTLISHDGVDAAQSGPVDHGAAVTVQATVIGPGTISFWWKVSSEYKDYLKFFINGVQHTQISGEQDWQQQTFAIPSGGPVVKWTYSKSPSGTAGQDRGWLDQVQFVPSNSCNLAVAPTNWTHSSSSSTGLVSVSTFAGCSWTVANTNAWVTIVSGATGSGNGLVEYLLTENSGAARRGHLVVADQLFTITQLAPDTNAIMSLSEAVDTVGASLAWGTISAPVWFGQTSISHDGVDAAQSGAVAHNAAVTMHTTVEGPGAISFWWKVSSEPNEDYLKFFINGVQQSRISGEVNWEFRRYIVPAGAHVFKWTYSKNANGGSSGLDRGWLDQVHFLPGTNDCVMALSHTSATHSANSETGQVNVTADPGCTWGVINTNAWITHTIDDGEGNGFVRYTLAANNSITDRTGVISIAGQPFTIMQLAGPCTYSISPTSRTHGYGAGAGTVAVTTQAGCAWNVINTNAWIMIVSSLNNSGSGQVIYSVSSNTTALARSGNIHIDGQLFTVSQSIAPIPLPEALDTVGTPIVWNTSQSNPNTSQSNPWSGQTSVTHDGVDAARSGSLGSSSSSGLQTGINGPGTLTFWWKVSSETNNDTLRFRVNGTEHSRISGEVDWQQRNVTLAAGFHWLELTYIKNASIAAGQDRGWIDQFQFVPGTNSNCSITLSPNSRAHGPAGVTNTVTVATQTGCPWHVFETSSWITILSGLTNWDNGTVIYKLAPNTNSQTRTGNIIVGGQQFLLTQAGASPSGTNAPRLQFMSLSGTGATLSVQGEEGKMYVVECSEDLIHWIPISTNSAPSTVTDAAAGNAPWRFYRTVESP